MDLLIKYGHMENKGSLKKTYYHYLNPMTLNYDTEDVWNTVASNSMIDIFQFDTETGQQTIKDIKPTSWLEIAQTNSLMRLQKQEGAKESPAESFVRFKNNINEWYQEMDEWGVPKKDQEILSRVLEQYKGVADTQEAIMVLSQLDEFAGFTIKQSHTLRKSVARKDKKAYEEVEELFYTKCKENNVNPNTAKYIWEVQVSRQKGYSFSILHCLVYSLIALQELVLYTQYPSIYWNTAVLTVNAGAMEDEDEGNKKQDTKYGEIATAIASIQKRGVTVGLPDINKAEYSFVPNEEENTIVFALKGMSKISDDEAIAIVKNRPYSSLKDFYKRMVLTKIEVKDKKDKVTKQSIVKPSAVINLIKGGAFDRIEGKPREEIMKDYLLMVKPPREKLDVRATQTVAEMGLVPKDFMFAIKIINFRNYVVDKRNYSHQDSSKKTKKWYVLRGHDLPSTDYTIKFFEEYFMPYLNEGDTEDYYYDDNDNIIFSANLKSTGFEKQYEKYIEKFKEWLNTEDCLDRYNYFKFLELWSKEANGSISKWEMDSLNYYYHEHELENINKKKYLVEDFQDLPEEPIIKAYGQYGKRKYPIYKLSRIAGTVIDKVAKDKMIYVLTTDGEVVGVKFYTGQYSFYDKNISQQTKEGKKTTIEEGWFKRGNKLLITGYRRGKQFIPKKYNGSAYQHTVSLITEVRDSDLVLQFTRARI